jgi:hypothetical protein
MKPPTKIPLNEDLSFAQLFNLSEPKRIVRSNTVSGPPLDIKAFDDAQYHIFNFKSNPSTTGLRHHGYIKFKKPGRDTAMTDVKCVVDCGCPDFKYRWAWANKQKGASVVGPKSMNQALNRAPRITNPAGHVGLCKHLLHLKTYLQGLMWELPQAGLNAPDDVLNGLIRFAQSRHTNMRQHMQTAKERDARFQAARAQARAGRPPTAPEELPPISPTADTQPPVTPGTSATEEPQMPNSVDDIKNMVPPKLILTPGKPNQKESLQRSSVDNMCTMTPLTRELALVRELIESAEAQTPPTEGEAAHGDALGLLKSIDNGIRTLNTGIEKLSAALSSADDREEMPEEPQEGDEHPDATQAPDAKPAEQGSAEFEKQLADLGVPQQ